MRLSNRSRKPLYSFIYSLVGIIFILGLIGYVLEINKFDVLGKKAWILVVIPLLLYLLLYLFGKPIFESIVMAKRSILEIITFVIYFLRKIRRMNFRNTNC